MPFGKRRKPDGDGLNPVEQNHFSLDQSRLGLGYLREAEKQAGWQTRRKSDRVAHCVFNKQD
jgi:hypothetical protein